MAASANGRDLNLVIDGRAIQGPVVNETIVRAAAGMTMVLGAVAFALAFLAGEYRPLRAVTAFFMIEFSVRVFVGLRWSPVGLLADLLFGRYKVEWVSAAPKRFAWSIGIAMSVVMTVLTNVGYRGTLPLVVCVLCLTLMWLEASVGYCVGCHMYRVLVQRGLIKPRSDYEVCANGECRLDDMPGKRPSSTAAVSA